jgi:hypothetical protein
MENEDSLCFSQEQTNCSQTVPTKTYAHFLYLAQFFSDWQMFQTKFVE